MTVQEERNTVFTKFPFQKCTLDLNGAALALGIVTQARITRKSPRTQQPHICLRGSSMCLHTERIERNSIEEEVLVPSIGAHARRIGL